MPGDDAMARCLTTESEIELVPRQSFRTVESISILDRATPDTLRPRVAAPRVARKGEAWCPWPESNPALIRDPVGIDLT